MSNIPPPPPAGDVPPYAAPGAGEPKPGYAAPTNSDKYNVLAIVSLVSAFFVSLVAVITGHLALGQIKRTQEKGRGLAIAGLVLGYLGILAGIIGIIVLVVVLAAAGSKVASDPSFGSDPGFGTVEPYPSATSDPGASGTQTTAEACIVLQQAVSSSASQLSENLSQLQTDPAAAVAALQQLSSDFDSGLADISDPDVYAAGDQANTSLKIMISDIQALQADPSAGNSAILDDAQAVQDDFSAIDTVCG